MEVEKVKIDTPYIKLDSFLKYMGLVETGGLAKYAIQCGYVFVNGKVCTVRGKKLSLSDQVKYKGKVYEIDQ